MKEPRLRGPARRRDSSDVAYSRRVDRAPQQWAVSIGWPRIRTLLLVCSLAGVFSAADCPGDLPTIGASAVITISVETIGSDLPAEAYTVVSRWYSRRGCPKPALRMNHDCQLLEEGIVGQINGTGNVRLEVQPNHPYEFLLVPARRGWRRWVQDNCASDAQGVGGSGSIWSGWVEGHAQYEITLNCHANRIAITAVTTGLDLDPDGYEVTVDGTVANIYVNDVEQQTIEINGTGTLRYLGAGADDWVYQVGLTDLDLGCSVTNGDNPRWVTTQEDETVPVAFEVACQSTGVVVLEDRFDDGSPVDGRWRKETAYQAGGVIDSVRHVSTGGDPDGYRYMVHVFPDSGAVIVRHFYTAGVYVPGEQGAVSHIIYQEDRKHIDKPTPSSAIGTLFILEQGGTVYWAPNSADNRFSSERWEHAVTPALAASDFSPAGLDFSAAGDTITFGYLRSNTNHGHSALTLKHGIDNWRVEVYRQ